MQNTAIRRMNQPILPIVPRVLAALAGGFTLFLVITLFVIAGFNLSYSGKIFPGISVAGVNLAGMRPEEARSLLESRLTYPQTGKIVFQDGADVWVARPLDLGLYLDSQTSVQVAYQMGRHGNMFSRLATQLAAWRTGKEMAPVLVYNELIAQQYLRDIAALIDRPVIEASLNINDLDVIVVPGQVGRQVNIDATLMALESQLSSQSDGLISLVMEETPPAILDASQQAELARSILSAPLVLQIPEAVEGDPGPWVIPPDQLARMLVIERVQSQEGWRYQVALDNQALNTYLSALVPDVNRQPENTHFIFNDDTRLLEIIEPAVIGRSLDIYTTIQDINDSVLQGQHTVSLIIATIQPDVGDEATGEQLGITELVNAYTSYFRGSTAERLQNIKTAAANFHGLLVPPGAIFSMAEVMGDVSLDTGYEEAWIIFGGRTIKGVGGGVCQVSTTLFRTAFFAGFPILERHPHAYRVGYYEQTLRGYDDDLAGLDATVFVPMVDFKFQNDTPYWLLMETYFNPTARSLTWKFYSTKDGRTVEWNTTGLQNIVEAPDPLYEENPELDKGEIKQVDWAADGADVTVTRSVLRDGQVIYSDVFTTHYLPWRDVFQYGPGTKLPTDKKKRRSELPIPPFFLVGMLVHISYNDRYLEIISQE